MKRGRQVNSPTTTDEELIKLCNNALKFLAAAKLSKASQAADPYFEKITRALLSRVSPEVCEIHEENDIFCQLDCDIVCPGKEKKAIELLQASNKKLLEANNPELDSTDGAHPAWWRGHVNGAEGVTRVMLKAFTEARHNGKFSDPKMNELRELIWNARERLGDM